METSPRQAVLTEWRSVTAAALRAAVQLAAQGTRDMIPVVLAFNRAKLYV